jgi:hypothetical protein
MTALHSQEWLCHRLSRREPELYDFRDPFAARMASLQQIVAEVTAEERATGRFVDCSDHFFTRSPTSKNFASVLSKYCVGLSEGHALKFGPKR